MDLSVHKNERCVLGQFHKQPHGLNVLKAKSSALKDITEVCKECNSFYTRNYLNIEHKILEYSNFDFIYINI